MGAIITPWLSLLYDSLIHWFAVLCLAGFGNLPGDMVCYFLDSAFFPLKSGMIFEFCGFIPVLQALLYLSLRHNTYPINLYVKRKGLRPNMNL